MLAIGIIFAAIAIFIGITDGSSAVVAFLVLLAFPVGMVAALLYLLVFGNPKK